MSYAGKIGLEFLLSKEFFEYQPTITQTSSKMYVSNDSNKEFPMQPSDYLVAFSTLSKSYCVGCVDMVNSTKIATHLTQKQLSSYYGIFLNSMSKVIGNFGGKVIKNIGDCLLYYFPNQSITTGDMKNFLDCGLAMIEAQTIICEKLESKGLPRLDYRISADYGSVVIMKTSDSASIDLIGPPVNICAKINRFAGKNEFVIGGDLREITKKLGGYVFEEIHGCNVGCRQTYTVFKVKCK